MKLISSILKYIFDFLVIFGFLFPMNPEGAHGLTSRRLSLVLAILVLFFRKPRVKSVLKKLNNRRIKAAIGYLIICVIIIFFHIVGNESFSYSDNEPFEIWYFAYLVLYCMVFPLFCTVEFENVEDFAKPYIGTFVIQFFAVLAAAISTPVRMMFYTLFYYGDDRFDKTIEYGSRIIGVALHSSTGSITCCTCAILLAYLLLKNRIRFSLFALFYGMVFITTLFIGRTGVLVEAVVLLFVAFVYRVRIAKNSLVIALVIAIFCFVFAKVMSSSDSGNAETLETWMTAIFDDESRQKTLDGINRSIPVFSIEFIFGSGILRGHTSGGSYVESDSGYVMIITALGFFGAIFYYLFFYKLYSFNYSIREDKLIKRFFALIIICSFVVEYKEPYMLKYTMPALIITLAIFERIDSNRLLSSENRNMIEKYNSVG